MIMPSPIIRHGFSLMTCVWRNKKKDSVAVADKVQNVEGMKRRLTSNWLMKEGEKSPKG